MNESRKLYKLAETAAVLRAENGCPWDREQTHETLKKYLIEETYEVIDAIDSKDDEKIKEELGDLLYQVYAHSEIAREQKRFDIDDVADGINAKLIRRHPHVFSVKDEITSDEVLTRWENIKKTEKKKGESAIDGVPKSLPALLKAYRTQEKTSRIGFDWDNIEGVEEKLDEEIAEFKEAVKSADKAKIKDEFGDILFTLVNISRFLDIDPEEALLHSTEKFSSRFRLVEKEAAKLEKKISDMTLDEMNSLWDKAKL
ncbi:MAG: nucleoside triphosphate pyrophosphohydrolase [Spirochaetes bacterium]|nr:nucleoside triphosphate pyrophosphohydrolase [Spirochaetota bacterium]